MSVFSTTTRFFKYITGRSLFASPCFFHKKKSPWSHINPAPDGISGTHLALRELRAVGQDVAWRLLGQNGCQETML